VNLAFDLGELLRENEVDVNLPMSRDKKIEKKCLLSEGGRNARTVSR